MWFGAMAWYAHIVEDAGLETYVKSVFLFRAEGWEDALENAMAIAGRAETAYQNNEGKRVVYKLVEIATLDMLTNGSLEGVEVYSEPEPAGREAP